jgi:hypothetical protein
MGTLMDNNSAASRKGEQLKRLQWHLRGIESTDVVAAEA